MRYRMRYRMQCDIACDKKDIASVKNPDARRVNAPHPTPTLPCSRSIFLSHRTHPRNTNIWSLKAMCAVMGWGAGGGGLPFQASLCASWLRAPKVGCCASVGRGPAFVLARFLMPSSSVRCVSILHSKQSNRESSCIQRKWRGMAPPTPSGSSIPLSAKLRCRPGAYSACLYAHRPQKRGQLH